MQEIFLTWGLGYEAWDTTTWKWDEIRFLSDFIAIDGDVPKKVFRKYIKKKLKDLSIEDKNKFIELYLKIDSEEIKDKKKKKKVTITVSEIEIILKEALKVEITF
ncbi:MAG: hypothetical protein ABIP51_05970 [Bacteroidia bacterium]